LSENWESDEVKSVVVDLRKLANDDFNAKIKGADEIENDVSSESLAYPFTHNIKFLVYSLTDC
jgi:hypothetical protein